MSEIQRSKSQERVIYGEIPTDATEEATGEGPYCALCLNARAEWLANPDTFDMHDHVQRCVVRTNRYLAKKGIK